MVHPTYTPVASYLDLTQAFPSHSLLSTTLSTFKVITIIVKIITIIIIMIMIIMIIIILLLLLSFFVTIIVITLKVERVVDRREWLGKA